jgi:hypothetical protein
MGRIRADERPVPLALGWWGVTGFCVLTLAAFTHFTQQQLDELAQLRQRQHELVVQRDRLVARNEQLRAQIRSQDQPSWIEQRLMSRLGVVPKGSRKVVFLDSSRS